MSGINTFFLMPAKLVTHGSQNRRFDQVPTRKRNYSCCRWHSKNGMFSGFVFMPMCAMKDHALRLNASEEKWKAFFARTGWQQTRFQETPPGFPYYYLNGLK